MAEIAIAEWSIFRPSKVFYDPKSFDFLPFSQVFFTGNLTEKLKREKRFSELSFATREKFLFMPFVE